MRVWGGTSILAISLLALAGCTPRAVTPLTAPAHDFAEAEDEAALIARAQRFDAEIRSRALVLSDVDVHAYLAGVLHRIMPADLGERAPHVRVLRSSVPTAYTLPNGSIYVSAALLVLLQDEAQLAHVLGHEAAHYVRRHAVLRQRDRDSKAVAASIANIALLGIPLGNSLYLASVTSYGREHEEEADRDGLTWMAAAGYDPVAAAEVYEHIEQAVGPQARGGSMWDTHPALQRRARYMRELIASGAVPVPPVPQRRVAEYRASVDPVRHVHIEVLLDAKRFTGAEQAADEAIVAHPDAAIFHCYKGEAKRGAADDPEFVALEAAWRGGTELTDETVAAETAKAHERRTGALADYQRCLELDPDEPLGCRGIGIVSQQMGDPERSRTALQRYLELSPEAYDRRWILSLLAGGASL